MRKPRVKRGGLNSCKLKLYTVTGRAGLASTLWPFFSRTDKRWPSFFRAEYLKWQKIVRSYFVLFPLEWCVALLYINGHIHPAVSFDSAVFSKVLSANHLHNERSSEGDKRWVRFCEAGFHTCDIMQPWNGTGLVQVQLGPPCCCTVSLTTRVLWDWAGLPAASISC